MPRSALVLAIALSACRKDDGDRRSDARVDAAPDAAPGRDGAIDVGRDVDGDAGSSEPDFVADVVLDDDATLAIDPASLSAAATACRESVAVRVAYAVDGDTIDVTALEGGPRERIRLIGVDTPEIAHAPSESDQCYGPEARDFTRLLVGRVVWLSFDRLCTDPYDRTLAYVTTSVGLWERQLLRRGFARVLIIGRNDLLEEQLTMDENIANREDRGLWGACL